MGSDGDLTILSEQTDEDIPVSGSETDGLSSGLGNITVPPASSFFVLGSIV